MPSEEVTEEEEEAHWLLLFSVVFDSTLSLPVPWSIEFCLINLALQEQELEQEQEQEQEQEKLCFFSWMHYLLGGYKLFT